MTVSRPYTPEPGSRADSLIAHLARYGACTSVMLARACGIEDPATVGGLLRGARRDGVVANELTPLHGSQVRAMWRIANPDHPAVLRHAAARQGADAMRLPEAQRRVLREISTWPPRPAIDLSSPYNRAEWAAQ